MKSLFLPNLKGESQLKNLAGEGVAVRRKAGYLCEKFLGIFQQLKFKENYIIWESFENIHWKLQKKTATQIPGLSLH